MSWRDSVGTYVSIKDGETVTLKFLHDEPRKAQREWKGKKREALEWDVELNEAKKLFQVSAYGLQRQLAEVRNLKDRQVRISRRGEGGETKYKVELVK